MNRFRIPVVLFYVLISRKRKLISVRVRFTDVFDQQEVPDEI